MSPLTLPQHCEELNNFNSVMEILSGINNYVVLRLDSLWSSLPSSKQKQLKALEDLMSPQHNFKKYKAALNSRHAPCLPYFGKEINSLLLSLTLHQRIIPP
jgi:son of sevenless